MTTETPQKGEIWQDSQGVLLTILDETRAFAFGSYHELKVSNLLKEHRPAKRVFDVNGLYVGDGRLDYPNGSAFR